MVTFKVIYKSDKEIIYEYYPEGDKESGAGRIRIDIVEETINIIEPAKRDIKRIVKADELNAMRDNINKMRKENGEPDLSEEELPVATEDSEYYWYASHALNKIAKAYDEGTILEEGMAAWY